MLKTPRSLGVILFPAFDWAISPTHPERQERLLYTQDQLHEEGLFDVEGVAEYKPHVATREDVERTHFCFPEVEDVCTRSHLAAAGGTMRAADLVLSGERDRAFALVRPPGHHAMKSVHGTRGFCTINTEAVMIEHLREHHGVKRIAVVDTDCHHGDGTQDIYWHDPDVLFISMHQDGRTLYPGSGFPHECGGPKARGRTVNIPLPPYTSDEGFLHVLEHIVMPILEDFQPEIVINSAGQDNHFSDPITTMNFSAQGYARLNSILNPHIAVLEGGYSIQGALPYVNLGICLAMAGMDYDGVREPDYPEGGLTQDPQITEYLKQLSDQLPQVYFNPPEDETHTRVGDYWARVKEVFYDTDGIREQQREMIYDCGNCRGLLRLETKSNRIQQSLGLEIPLHACDACRDEGYRVFEDAQLKGGYRYIQFVNRRDNELERVGF
ncbi:histone deacetylase family protein [Desulfohalovibrio reitneri]|uniref:histone deacetylase family protein n=1 Tax=Desulfohalovibrio reitneri TaxID=1307759 RepID=UPI0004A75A7E|nr:histone deacetylase [Desulfohalovibrio reitneri]